MSRAFGEAKQRQRSTLSRSDRLWRSLALCVYGTAFGGCSGEDLYPASRDPVRVDVRVENYCPRPGYSASGLFVTNNSLWLGSDGRQWIDHDRDGLSDDFESLAEHVNEFSIDPMDPDTMKDGYGDMVVSALGMVWEDQEELPECVQRYQDLDRDGLDDCEEDLVGTDTFDPDTDADGIPDGLEVRHGFNPLDIEDAHLDSDQDGLPVTEEIRRNTPPRLHNDEMPDFHGIAYDVVDRVREDGSMCQQIDVESIPLGKLDNGNLVRMWFLEKGFAPGHGALSELRTVTLVISQIVEHGSRFTVKEVTNQFQTEGFPHEKK